MLPLRPGGAPISVTGTQTGQGSWKRVEKNVYAFTVLADPDGPGRQSVRLDTVLGVDHDRTRRIVSQEDQRGLPRWTSSH